MNTPDRSPPCAATPAPRPHRIARGLLVLLAAAAPLACGEPDAPPVRLVLISLDTLRADRFDADRMPALTEAAAHGLVLRNFHAATSVTLPTHVSMFSGLHPWQHGVLRNGVIVRDDVTMLAERLRDSGFSTAAVVASFPLERRFHCDQGFDTYIDEFVARTDKDTWNDQRIPGALFSSPADTVAGHALRLLDEAQGDRQFFFFHFFDPHAPYGDSGDAPPGGPMDLSVLLKSARNRAPGLAAEITRAETLYDADVRFLDEVLGRLLARIEADADDFETHVLITADHGESFGDDGSLGHGKRVSPPQIRVPFVLLSPEAPAGVRTDIAGSVDIAPTLLALAGLPPDRSLPGRDLLARVPAEPTAVGMRSLFSETPRDVRTDGTAFPVDALRFYIAQSGGHVTGGAGDVLDLDLETDKDPSGAALTPAETAKITRLFDGFASEVRVRMAEMVESADPETRAALEALGYTR